MESSGKWPSHKRNFNPEQGRSALILWTKMNDSRTNGIARDHFAGMDVLPFGDLAGFEQQFIALVIIK
jgi:hypothetical protein